MITGADLPLTSVHGVLHRRPSLLRSTVVFSFFVGGSGSGWRTNRFHIPAWNINLVFLNIVFFNFYFPAWVCDDIYARHTCIGLKRQNFCNRKSVMLLCQKTCGYCGKIPYIVSEFVLYTARSVTNISHCCILNKFLCIFTRVACFISICNSFWVNYCEVCARQIKKFAFCNLYKKPGFLFIYLICLCFTLIFVHNSSICRRCWMVKLVSVVSV